MIRIIILMVIKNRVRTLIVAIVFMLWSYLTIHAFGYGHNIVYCFSTLLILYATCHIAKKIAKLFILLLTVLAFILQPVTSLFGSLDINIIAAIKYTNTKEALEMMESFSLIDFFIMLIIATLGITVFKLIDTVNTKNKPAIAAAVISLSVIMYKPIFSSKHNGYMDAIHYPPIRLFVSIKNSIDTIATEERAFAIQKQLSSDFSPAVTNRKYNTYILVIGESVRRDHMGVYGFPVNNTPFLSSVNATTFDNYVSSSFSTALSLTHSLILSKDGKPEFNNNIIRLAKLSGLHTYWLSKQSIFGINDSPVAIIGKDADYTNFINSKDVVNHSEYYPDEDLLPEYDRIMKE